VPVLAGEHVPGTPVPGYVVCAGGEPGSRVG
jgi:hypothetical protein